VDIYDDIGLKYFQNIWGDVSKGRPPPQILEGTIPCCPPSKSLPLIASNLKQFLSNDSATDTLSPIVRSLLAVKGYKAIAPTILEL